MNDKMKAVSVPNGHWHLRKEFTLGTIAVLMGAFITGYVDIRVSLNEVRAHLHAPSHAQTEARVDVLEQRMAGVDVQALAINTQLADIKTALVRIEDRLNQQQFDAKK